MDHDGDRPAAPEQLNDGWLIERCGPSGPGEKRYLQIGTGQWCGAAYATVFPQPSTAELYAVDFGYEPGKSVRVVRCRSI